MTDMQQTDPAAGDAAYDEPAEVTGWVAWVMFAGTMMFLVGSFQVMAGLVALLDDDYYLVRPSGLVVNVDYTAWGWVHLLFGILLIATGIGAMFGQTWARAVGVVLTAATALINFAFLTAYPIWATVVIALCAVVIYALIVHGAEARAMH